MCALRWSDINLERLELFVKHSNNGRRIKDTKTHQRRKQAIDVITRVVLTAHRTRAEERCKALGGELACDAFVFSTEADSSLPLKPPSVSQRYRRLAERVKIHTRRIKDLRPYNVTELLGALIGLSSSPIVHESSDDQRQECLMFEICFSKSQPSIFSSDKSREPSSQANILEIPAHL